MVENTNEESNVIVRDLALPPDQSGRCNQVSKIGRRRSAIVSIMQRQRR